MAIVLGSVNPAVGIPPLSEEHRIALETAYDGRGHLEGAFDALVRHTSTWTGELGDAAIRLQPDFAAMLNDPDAYRGDLCLIEGRLEQIEPLHAPFVGVTAWFVRVDAEERAVLAYVNFRPQGVIEPQKAFRPGDRVSLAARFYKRIDREARDGAIHQYPAFVGAFPQLAGIAPVAAPSNDLMYLTLMATLVAGLGAVFLVVYILARRTGRHRGPNRIRSEFDGARALDLEEYHGPVDIDLPDDPAQALDVLKRKATETDHHAQR